MKSINMFIILLCLLIVMTGCGVTTENQNSNIESSLLNIDNSDYVEGNLKSPNSDIDNKNIDLTQKDFNKINGYIGEPATDSQIDIIKEAYERMVALFDVYSGDIADNISDFEPVIIDNEEYYLYNCPIVKEVYGKKYIINSVSELKKFTKDLISQRYFETSINIQEVFLSYRDYNGVLARDGSSVGFMIGNEVLFDETRVIHGGVTRKSSRYDSLVVLIPTVSVEYNRIYWYILDIVYENGMYKLDRECYIVAIEDLG